MLTICDCKLVNDQGEEDDEVTCPGHLAKFDDCVQEALYELTLDNCGEMSTGSDEFEGTFTLFNYPFAEAFLTAVGSAEERWVVIPEGHYILQTSGGGFVYTLKYPSYEEARAAYDMADDRYMRWDKGCEQTGHRECEEHDECQLGGTPSW